MNGFDFVGNNKRYISPEEQNVIESTKNLKNSNIENDFVVIQAMVFELQRQICKQDEFSSNLYEKVNSTSKSINELLNYYKDLVDRVQYIKDVMDGLKTSQEMGEGYREYINKNVNDLKLDLFNSYQSTFVPVSNNIIVNYGNHTVNEVQSTIENSVAEALKKAKLSL